MCAVLALHNLQPPLSQTTIPVKTSLPTTFDNISTVAVDECKRIPCRFLFVENDSQSIDMAKNILFP